MTKIEWTEKTWNPIVGCTKTSPGCAYCYAEVMAKRLQAAGMPGYENGFAVSLRPEKLKEPLHRAKPTMYFVNSMSDLFHESVPFEYIDRVFETINRTPQHTYQVLTKRAARMEEFFSARDVPANAWLGVTVENQKHGLPRIDHLRGIDAEVRFLSIEPLLEHLGEIDLKGIHWVIVGGESGPHARRMLEPWVESIRWQCYASDVSFFFKQWGNIGRDGKFRPKKANGRLLKGRTWDEMPSVRSEHVSQKIKLLA
jgi:protein gp37